MHSPVSFLLGMLVRQAKAEAAIWSPHRPRGTPPKNRKRLRKTKLVGAKGLR